MVIEMDKKIILDLANKKKKGFDQMASMHFKLSDKYKRFSNIEDTIEIVISVLLCGVTFLDCEKYFHIPSNISSLIIGFVSIFLLAFTLIKQNLGHKELCQILNMRTSITLKDIPQYADVMKPAEALCAVL